MTVSHLTHGRRAMIDTTVEQFTALGYARAPLTEGPHAYYVRVLNGLAGGGHTVLNTGRDRTLALIASHQTGSAVSELTTSETEMWAELVNAGEEAPPAGYHADAVHFDGAALLSIASLTATNNAYCSIAFWFKCTFAQSSGRSHWMTDPDTNANNVAFSYNVGGNRGWSVQFNNTSTGNLVVSTDTGLADGVWYCVVASFDTNHIAGARTYKIYVNDVDMTTLDTDAGPAFTMLFNALGMTVGGDGGSGYIGDMAEFRFMPGVSLLDGSGDIPQATRRLFRDAGGKPVDPATATSTLGAPCILFSGTAAAFGTNQGTGGAFTTTGALTNASTSPSG